MKTYFQTPPPTHTNFYPPPLPHSHPHAHLLSLWGKPPDMGMARHTGAHPRGPDMAVATGWPWAGFQGSEGSALPIQGPRRPCTRTTEQGAPISGCLIFRARENPFTEIGRDTWYMHDAPYVGLHAPIVQNSGSLLTPLIVMIANTLKHSFQECSTTKTSISVVALHSAVPLLHTCLAPIR